MQKIFDITIVYYIVRKLDILESIIFRLQLFFKTLKLSKLPYYQFQEGCQQVFRM